MTVVLAFDKSTVRSFDQDGRLHVEISNISKANICPYYGREIPNCEEMGLDPNRIYKLFRHPDELAAAAHTFNNIPILSEHVPVNAAAPRQDLIVGSTGTDAEFSDPYLRNSLVVWTAEAIDGIEGEDKRELSSSYHYTADMTPGEYNGEKYDGVMRNIRGNHVALVEAGRAGPDVIVGDAAMKDTGMKKRLTRKGVLVKGALLASTSIKLAADAKLDLDALLSGVDAKNYASKKPGIIAGIKPKLAADADLEGVVKLLDMLDHEVAEDPAADEDEDTGMDAEGLSDEEEAQFQALLKRRKPGAEDEAEDGDKPGCDEDEDKDKAAAPPTKAAMDAAIRTAEAATVKRMNDIRVAEKAVFPHVGEVVAMDSAEEVYKFALDAAGVSTKGVHPSAFGPMVKMLPTPGSSATVKVGIAMDAKAEDDFMKKFPGAGRVRTI